MVNKRKLAPTDMEPLFGSMDRTKATRYLHISMTNPETPSENLELMEQYRQQHPEKFLTNEEIEANPQIFQQRKRGRNAFGRVYDSDGYSHDNYGNSFDRFGNEVGGWHDGDDDSVQYGKGYGGGREKKPFFMTREILERGGSENGAHGGVRKQSRKNDPSKPMSPSQVNSLMFGLRSDYARTRYFQKVRDNAESNIETVDALIFFKDKHPDMFVPESEANRIAKERMNRSNSRKGGYGDVGNGYRSYNSGYSNQGGVGYRDGYRSQRFSRDYDKPTWDAAWKSRDEFDVMPKRKQSLYATFFGTRDRNRASKLALKIFSDPGSSQEDVRYTGEIVRETPGIFFKGKSNKTSR